MLNIPLKISKRYDELLTKSQINQRQRGHFKKWLRFYLDYCSKYQHAPNEQRSLSLFVQKLVDKGQSNFQCQQAQQSVQIYYQLIDTAITRTSEASGADCVIPVNRQKDVVYSDVSKATVNVSQHAVDAQAVADIRTGCEYVASPGVSWVSVYGTLTEEIKFRHYSPKTLKAYRGWIRKFQTYLKSKDPQSLCQSDIKRFLSFS
jgi:hypothetical protein